MDVTGARSGHGGQLGRAVARGADRHQAEHPLPLRLDPPTHIHPAWGQHRLADASHADVAAWVARFRSHGSAPATVRQTHRVFSLLLALAARDGRIPRNPADKCRCRG